MSKNQQICEIIADVLICIAIIVILSTVFIVNPELGNSTVSGKYFWFYTSMTLLAVVAVPVAIVKRKERFKFTLNDLLLLLFCCVALTGTLIYEERLTNKCYLLVFLGLFYCYARMFFSGKSKRIQYLSVLFFMLTGLFEAVWGLRQLYGFTLSQHNLFKITGSFFNPGPYSGWLAMIFPVAFWYAISGFTSPPLPLKRIGIDKWLSDWIMIITGFLTAVCILLILPAAMSRAAWMAALGGSAFIGVIYGIQNKKKWDYFRKRRKKVFMLLVVGVILFVVSMIGLFLLKKDSASGRMFVWKIAMRVIKEHPVGVGLGNFGGSYGDIQSEYFASGFRTEWEEYVAEGVEYAFNEYLQICIETGIVPFILFISFVGYTIVRGIRNRKYLPTGSLVSLLIFAFMSYPFNILPFAIAFVFLAVLCISADEVFQSSRTQKFLRCTQCFFICVAPVIVGLCLYRVCPSYEAYKQWNITKSMYSANMHREVVKKYAKLYSYLQDEIQFLFEYAQSLSKTGEYEKSNEILKRSMQISCDPML